MLSLQLNDELSLSAEKIGNSTRLILTDVSGTEVVCHKVTAYQLIAFIACAEGHLFKERLQLDKNNETIVVQVKGRAIGAITAKELHGLASL